MVLTCWAICRKHRRSLPVILLSGMPLDQIQQHIHGLPNAELPPLMLKPIDMDQLTQVLELQLRGDLSRSLEEDAKQRQHFQLIQSTGPDVSGKIGVILRARAPRPQHRTSGPLPPTPVPQARARGF